MNKAHFLWVDDEIDLMKPYILFLQEKGYKTDCAVSGNDALEMCSRKRYDILFLDEQMPGNREVDIIRHSVEHLRALICRTKTHTDRVTLEPDFCDVRALFEQLIHETPHAPALTLEVAACDDAPLFCDKTHIHETLTNLISNASEAMRGSGRITLSYTHAKAARKAVISVSDNGPGMTPEQQKRIFEPYFTTKSSGENFGLGLYYCQNVMNAHGGSITVRSTPGEGSTFSLRFHSSPEERTRP